MQVPTSEVSLKLSSAGDTESFAPLSSLTQSCLKADEWEQILKWHGPVPKGWKQRANGMDTEELLALHQLFILT